MAEIQWHKDIDSGLAEAKQLGKPVLVDFSAAPMWAGCARLEAEVYPDKKVVDFIHLNFVAIKVHVKENPQGFKRFGAQWTPTQMILDSNGVERHRMEGFFGVDDFIAQLELGLAKLHFQQEDFVDAARRFRSVYLEHPDSSAAAEAMYWAGVSDYKATNESSHLKNTGVQLAEKFPNTEWAKKGSVWL